MAVMVVQHGSCWESWHNLGNHFENLMCPLCTFVINDLNECIHSDWNIIRTLKISRILNLTGPRVAFWQATYYLKYQDNAPNHQRFNQITKYCTKQWKKMWTLIWYVSFGWKCECCLKWWWWEQHMVWNASSLTKCGFWFHLIWPQETF